MDGHGNSVKRIFLVGCSRSGTTIVQREAIKALNLYSLPETDFFGLLFGNKVWQTFGRFGWVKNKRACLAVTAFQNARSERRYSRMYCPIKKPLIQTKSLVNFFSKAMDNATLAAEKGGWLEKTPKHFKYIEEIEHYVAHSKFVHVVRDGRDVVASIRDRAMRYPEDFPAQHDLDYAIKLWNRAIKVAYRRAKVNDDFFFLYEDFVENPSHSVASLGRHLGIPVQQLAESESQASIVRETEYWKGSASTPVYKRESKFFLVLSRSEQEYVERKLDWQRYRLLVNKARGPQ